MMTMDFGRKKKRVSRCDMKTPMVDGGTRERTRKRTINCKNIFFHFRFQYVKTLVTSNLIWVFATKTVPRVRKYNFKTRTTEHSLTH